MAWAVKFNPEGTTGNDVVTITNIVTFNAGTTDWTIEFSLALAELPSTGNWYIFGSSATTQNSGFCLRAASGSGVFSIVSTGSHVPAADSPSNFIVADGTLHTYRIERVAGASISFYRDNAPVLENKTWSTTSNFPLALSRFGRGSISGGVCTPMVLAWFDATATVSANGQRWNSDLTSGSGTIWATDSGNNQGTLVNFAAEAEWEFYSDGSTETASIDSTYPKYTAAVTGTNTKPVFNTSVDSTYGKYTGTVSAGVVTPGINASISANYPKYTSTVTGSNIKPVRTASISSSYGKYTATVTGTNIKPVRTASVNSTYSKHTASINAGIVSTNRQTSINSTYPKYTGSITGTNTKPVFNGSVNSTYAKHTASVTGNNTKPVLTTTINSSYGKHTVNVSIGGFYLNRTAAVNSAYAKHTASVAASLLLQDRSCTINGSYPKHFAVVIQGQVNLTTKAGKGRNLDISFGSRNYQYYAGLREITVEV